jgi:hypothetical protein
MMEEFHVCYLSHLYQEDPDEGPDKLVSCRFLADSKEDALRIAKEKIPHVIAGFADEGTTEDVIEIEVRPWAAWGKQLDRNWDAICNTEPEEDDE